MTSTKILPQVAQQLGYDLDGMNDSELVTLVRRTVSYEELVVTKQEFEEFNQKIKNNEDFCLFELEMDDAQCIDLSIEETQYTAFSGDVTSFTDDAIAFMFTDVVWTDSHELLNLATENILN
jgi:hypothetical protein